MFAFIEVAYNVIAPIFICIGLAALVGRRYNPDPRAISSLIIYLFSPFLVFDGISRSDLQAGEIGQITAMVVLISLAMALVGWGLARLLRLDRRTTSAFMLTVMLINAGNYGIPLNRFAFGEAGEQRALIFYVMSAVVANTLGVFLASRGTASVRESLINVFKVPLPYAMVLGFIVNIADITLPLPVERAASLLGQAAVPAMLTLLGLQLARVSIRGRITPILTAAGARLIIAPLLAFLFAALLGLQGLVRQVCIIESSMSTAVMSNVLATEFNSDGEFTATVILVSTLASIITLSTLLLIV